MDHSLTTGSIPPAKSQVYAAVPICKRRPRSNFPTTTGGLQVRDFFNVEGNGRIFDDKEGTVLSGIEVAMLQAAVIAAELAQDDDEYKGYVVRVADEHGSEIARCRSLLRFKTAAGRRAAGRQLRVAEERRRPGVIPIGGCGICS
jgi:hypothetical protein